MASKASRGPARGMPLPVGVLAACAVASASFHLMKIARGLPRKRSCPTSDLRRPADDRIGENSRQRARDHPLRRRGVAEHTVPMNKTLNERQPVDDPARRQRLVGLPAVRGRPERRLSAELASGRCRLLPGRRPRRLRLLGILHAPRRWTALAQRSTRRPAGSPTARRSFARSLPAAPLCSSRATTRTRAPPTSPRPLPSRAATRPPRASMPARRPRGRRRRSSPGRRGRRGTDPPSASPRASPAGAFAASWTAARSPAAARPRPTAGSGSALTPSR